MPADALKQAKAAENRRRYEELRAAGQEATPKGLPPLTELGGAPIAPDSVIAREAVPASWYHALKLLPGEAIRIADPTGQASPALIGWHANDPSERLNCADTAKVQWSAGMAKGRVLLTDMGRVFLSIIEDTSGAHDLLVGGSSPASAKAAYGEATMRSTQGNFLAAASKLGLGLRDLHSCISFFAPVALDEEGRFHWHANRKRAGDFIDLRAQMPLLLVVSNCPHPLDPRRPAPDAAIEITRFRAGPAGADDLCRTASPEAARAFTFTDHAMA